MKNVDTLTIGGLAKESGVGVETIRYYQRLGLIPVPSIKVGAVRRYPSEIASRVRFIKRSQRLGFSLNEISSLLRLETERDNMAIREIAITRLDDIQSRIKDLLEMQQVLSGLIHSCKQAGGDAPCPIIASLTSQS